MMVMKRTIRNSSERLIFENTPVNSLLVFIISSLENYRKLCTVTWSVFTEDEIIRKTKEVQQEVAEWGLRLSQGAWQHVHAFDFCVSHLRNLNSYKGYLQNHTLEIWQTGTIQWEPEWGILWEKPVNQQRRYIKRRNSSQETAVWCLVDT